MAKFAFVALAALALGASLAVPLSAADDKVDVNGAWDAEVEIAGQTGTPSFVLKQEGEKITGRYKGQFGEAELKGKVKGKDVEWSFEVQGAKITYTGKVEDKDTIKGMADYDGQASGTFTAKKKPPEKKS